MTDPHGPAEKPSLGRRFLRTCKGLILWDKERGSWQYDFMVALILAFVFLTPARYFHDRPVYNPNPLGDVVLLGTEPAGTRYRVSAELLELYDSDPRRAAEMVFRQNLDHPFTITDIKEVEGQGSRSIWYDVWLRENERR